MLEKITVQDALKKGNHMVNLPVLGILVGNWLLAGGLFAAKIVSHPALIILIVLAGFVGSWLWWSIHITKWRVWAFGNVRNVHELKKRAIEAKLIWPDDSWFNKTEMWSVEKQDEWQRIQPKFNKEDVYENDLAVPNETRIYYAKGKNYVEMIMFIVLMGFGIFMLSKTDSKIFGTLLTIVGVYLAFKEFKQATNDQPQIILSNKGIETINMEFHPWSAIKNEDVVMIQSGKYAHFYLEYDTPDSNYQLLIDDYDINRDELFHLLKTYRTRSGNNNSSLQ